MKPFVPTLPPDADTTDTCPTPLQRTLKNRRRRLRYVLSTVALQAVLLASGLAVALDQAKAIKGEAVERFVLDQNIRTAEAVASTIREMGPQNIEFGTPEWERMQRMVEQIKLSSDGFVCVLDAEGKVLCHPDLRRVPEMRGMPMNDAVLMTADHGQVRLGSAPDAPLAGAMDMGEGETHMVATTALPSIRGRLTVHQPQSGLASAGEIATDGIWIPFVAVGGVVVVLTGLIGHALVRRHDKVLEQVNEHLEHELQLRIVQSLHTRDALIRGLAKLADYRDTDTGTHLDRIAEYSALLADELRGSFPEITDAWIATLRTASSLHDIGKVGIPDAVLLKPGRFTPEEREIMERHPAIGTDTLIAVRETMGKDELVEMSVRVTLYHHERWDGKGYPMGLSGEMIPLEARIVALADVYDALTSKRVYKDAMAHDRVVDIIREGTGTQFDPAVVEAFLRVQDRFDTIRARLQPVDPESQSSKRAA